MNGLEMHKHLIIHTFSGVINPSLDLKKGEGKETVREWEGNKRE